MNVRSIPVSAAISFVSVLIASSAGDYLTWSAGRSAVSYQWCNSSAIERQKHTKNFGISATRPAAEPTRTNVTTFNLLHYREANGDETCREHKLLLALRKIFDIRGSLICFCTVFARLRILLTYDSRPEHIQTLLYPLSVPSQPTSEHLSNPVELSV